MTDPDWQADLLRRLTPSDAADQPDPPDATQPPADQRRQGDPEYGDQPAPGPAGPAGGPGMSYPPGPGQSYPPGQQSYGPGQQSYGSGPQQGQGPQSYGPGPQQGPGTPYSPGPQPGYPPDPQAPYPNDAAGSYPPGSQASYQSDSSYSPGYPPDPQAPGPGVMEQSYPQRGGDAGPGMLRSIGRFASQAAMYLGGGSGQVRRDVENIAAIRRSLPITRMVGVLSPVAEGGTSTVAALLADTLAGQRTDRVLAVDADPVEAELSRRLELAAGPGAAGGVELTRCDPTADSLREVLGGGQGTGARGYGLVVVDCPGGMTGEVSGYVGSTGHAFVVSVPSVEHVARHCLEQLDQMPPEGQRLLLAHAVFAVCVVQPQDQDRLGGLTGQLESRGLQYAVLPYDEHLAETWPVRPDQMRPATRRAALELGARVVTLCANA